MTPLCHIVEPVGLLLTWQPQDEQAKIRTRRVVAEIRLDDHGNAVFKYGKGTPDFELAVAAGFQGFPAFSQKADEVVAGVVESLLRRLPPRKRDDFPEFLAHHCLPHPFVYSDIALLGYTGARLPSDGFVLVPLFPTNLPPCDFILEVAGFRYAEGADVSKLTVGDAVSFAIDNENPVDKDAIGILHNGLRIGYVNRALKNSFDFWLKTYCVSAIIERLNGQANRPLVYLRVTIFPANT